MSDYRNEVKVILESNIRDLESLDNIIKEELDDIYLNLLESNILLLNLMYNLLILNNDFLQKVSNTSYDTEDFIRNANISFL